MTAALKQVPKWLLAFGIMAYATGFLTLYIFFRRGFDIADIGYDFFKPQYIHVGLLYFGLVLLTAMPLSARTFRKARAINAPAILLAFNFLMVFYVFAIFTPPGFASKADRWFLLVGVVGMTLVGLTGIKVGVDYYVKDPEKNIYWKNALRWIIVIVLFIVEAILFADIATDLVDMIVSGGSFFFGIVILGVLLATRLILVYRQDYIFSAYEQNELSVVKGIFVTIGAGMIGAFYYLSVLSFAFFIFPYIPANKGGGDFRFSGDVRIVFRTEADAIAVLPISQQSNTKSSTKLKLIHETAAAIFVADPSDAQGPDNWMRHSRGANRPSVLGINKWRINSVMSVPCPAPVRAWPTADLVEIHITREDFKPHRVELRPDRPAIIRITNADDRPLVFNAARFFSATALRNITIDDQNLKERCPDAIDIPPNSILNIGVVPLQRGQFPFSIDIPPNSILNIGGEPLQSGFLPFGSANMPGNWGDAVMYLEGDLIVK